MTQEVNPGWRAAIAVELYDAGTLITTIDAGVFGTTAFPGLRVGGATLWQLARHFGLESLPAESYPGARTEKLFDAEFNIERQTVWYASEPGEEVKAVEARILPAGLLELRVTIATGKENDTYTQHFTYAGRFAIEWAAEDEG